MSESESDAERAKEALRQQAMRDLRLIDRHAIYRRDGYACRYCGAAEDGEQLCLDHVLPAARGGATEPHNLVTSCRSCNSRKRGRTPVEAGMQLRATVAS